MANSKNVNTGIGLREWCRANNVAPSTLAKALATGRVARLPDGGLDVRSADEWLAARGTTPPRRPAARGGPRRGSVADAQRRLTDARAKLARLEYLKKKGDLWPADEVRTAAFNAARRTRDYLLMIPSRIQHELAVMTDPVEVGRRLEKEMRAACDHLAKSKTG